MQGSAFIVHQNGWSCSNEVLIDVETDIENGQSRKTSFLKLKGVFDGKGQLEKDIFVECLFKKEDDGSLQGFAGRITGIVPTKTVIQILGKINKTEEILSKIKEEN